MMRFKFILASLIFTIAFLLLSCNAQETLSSTLNNGKTCKTKEDCTITPLGEGCSNINVKIPCYNACMVRQSTLNTAGKSCSCENNICKLEFDNQKACQYLCEIAKVYNCTSDVGSTIKFTSLKDGLKELSCEKYENKYACC